MALNAAQLAAIRAEVGSTPDDATLQLIFDRTANLGAVAVEVISMRLSDLLASPATFTIIGDYSQSNETNIAGLRSQLSRLHGLSGDDGSALFGTERLRQISVEFSDR